MLGIEHGDGIMKRLYVKYGRWSGKIRVLADGDRKKILQIEESQKSFEQYCIFCSFLRAILSKRIFTDHIDHLFFK